MLTFWDTVRGVELAETLIQELPKLTKKKKQKVIKVTNIDEITECLDEGWLIKTTFEVERKPENSKVVYTHLHQDTYVVLEK